jgi:hypothetical protein
MVKHFNGSNLLLKRSKGSEGGRDFIFLDRVKSSEFERSGRKEQFQALKALGWFSTPRPSHSLACLRIPCRVLAWNQDKGEWNRAQVARKRTREQMIRQVYDHVLREMILTLLQWTSTPVVMTTRLEALCSLLTK